MILTLRPAQLADKDFCQGLLDAYCQQWKLEFHEISLDELFIIATPHVPIGCITIERHQRVIYLLNFFMLPAYQGLGIGRQLLTTIKQLSDLPIELVVQRRNPAAQLYLRCGFYQTGELGDHLHLRMEPDAQA